MRVFHSSIFIVEKPDTVHSRKHLDFGIGFYVTALYDQAKNYAMRFIARGKPAHINEYELNLDKLDEFKVLKFDTYDENWLDFVMSCRSGNDTTDWDIVIGGIANDRIFTTVDLYFAGEITKEEALGD